MRTLSTSTVLKRCSDIYHEVRTLEAILSGHALLLRTVALYYTEGVVCQYV